MWDLEGIDVGHKMRNGGAGVIGKKRTSKSCTGGLGKGGGVGRGAWGKGEGVGRCFSRFRN